MFDASELITQREVVSQRVNELLQERAESFHLLLDDISIVSMKPLSNILFTPLFSLPLFALLSKVIFVISSCDKNKPLWAFL